MCSTLRFVVVRRVLKLVGLGRKPDEKDVEIAVLRHQLAILGRQVPRLRFNDSDRLLLSMLARLLPRDIVVRVARTGCRQAARRTSRAVASPCCVLSGRLDHTLGWTDAGRLYAPVGHEHVS